MNREENVSTGASNDLEKATHYALSMAYEWGMTPVRVQRWCEK